MALREPLKVAECDAEMKAELEATEGESVAESVTVCDGGAVAELVGVAVQDDVRLLSSVAVPVAVNVLLRRVMRSVGNVSVSEREPSSDGVPDSVLVAVLEGVGLRVPLADQDAVCVPDGRVKDRLGDVWVMVRSSVTEMDWRADVVATSDAVGGPGVREWLRVAVLLDVAVRVRALVGDCVAVLVTSFETEGEREPVRVSDIVAVIVRFSLEMDTLSVSEGSSVHDRVLVSGSVSESEICRVMVVLDSVIVRSPVALCERRTVSLPEKESVTDRDADSDKEPEKDSETDRVLDGGSADGDGDTESVFDVEATIEKLSVALRSSEKEGLDVFFVRDSTAVRVVFVSDMEMSPVSVTVVVRCGLSVNVADVSVDSVTVFDRVGVMLPEKERVASSVGVTLCDATDDSDRDAVRVLDPVALRVAAGVDVPAVRDLVSETDTDLMAVLLNDRDPSCVTDALLDGSVTDSVTDPVSVSDLDTVIEASCETVTVTLGVADGVAEWSNVPVRPVKLPEADQDAETSEESETVLESEEDTLRCTVPERESEKVGLRDEEWVGDSEMDRAAVSETETLARVRVLVTEEEKLPEVSAVLELVAEGPGPVRLRVSEGERVPNVSVADAREKL